ncbi:maleylpyruvate isomerase family mycothiol-dependent enzyme [Streptomyces sp. AC627_RSS907]|uniref:maleylpyruvate isomerase family mycothiol-dependent enzyme n=1 Tax=Streptomyces sp. AC627_RSS907 TaxID=2823684 RepID=UPI001C24D665|nr:maleylpyruvate isomerase family mycothiol-dependent enzyme [Streptomyces sp. AC627_RSS907]
MEFTRFLDCLAADYDRLRTVVGTDADAPVPTCPGWTVADLSRHVGEVYLHKTVAMREGVEPEAWPPKEFAEEEPTALLDRGYTALRAEFATRAPGTPAATWYGPDQSVGFWIRRMAQETVVHRVDAELATGRPVTPVPDDLAVDGVDELLKIFAAYAVAEWGDYFTDILAASPGRTFLVRAGDAAWRVRTGPGEFTVTDGAEGGPPDVTLSGSPEAVLRRLWNRDGADGGVTVEGDPDAVEELRRCIVVATQ